MLTIRTLTAVVLLGVLAGTARADDLRVGGLKYANVVVTDFRDGEITFRFKGNQVSKKLRDVRDLFLDAYPEIANGEAMYKDGRMDDAVRYYEALLPKVKADYVKALLLQRIADAKNPPSAEPKPAPKPAPVVVAPPAVVPELRSCDAFLTFLRTCPLDRSEKDWAPRTSAWRTRMVDLRGQLVQWTLKGASVAETPGGLAVRARLGNRAVVAGLITQRDATAIEEAGYEPVITVQATIGDYYARQGGRWRNVSLNPTMYDDSPMGIEMLDVVVKAAMPGAVPPAEPVNPSPVRPERPTVRPEPTRPQPRPEPKREPKDGPKMEPIQPVRPSKPVEPDIDITTPLPPDRPAPMEPLPARTTRKRIELPKDHGRKTIFDF